MTLDNNLLKKIENFKRHVLKSIPLPSTNTPSSDSTNGSTGSSLEYARSDHQHPKSTLYAESVHSHNDILSDLMDDINNTTVVVDSPNPIGQDGDTILLRGRMYGDDVSGKSIDYYIGNTLIGSSVTNGNGVSFLNYECDGLGVRNVTAKNGSIVSGTVSVHDCLFADRGDGTLNSNWGWYNTTGGSASITGDGISIGNTGSVFGVFYADDPNKSGRYDWETPHCVEFDVVSSTDYSKVYTYYYDGIYQGFINSFSNFDIQNGSHVKIVNNGERAELFVDGDSKLATNRSMTPDWVGIRLNSGGDLIFKNFEIYLI